MPDDPNLSPRAEDAAHKDWETRIRQAPVRAAWGTETAGKLRALPRVTNADGSRWVNADEVEALAVKLERAE
jgi:hypothetical protein